MFFWWLTVTSCSDHFQSQRNCKGRRQPPNNCSATVATHLFAVDGLTQLVTFWLFSFINASLLSTCAILLLSCGRALSVEVTLCGGFLFQIYELLAGMSVGSKLVHFCVCRQQQICTCVDAHKLLWKQGPIASATQPLQRQQDLSCS